MCPFHRRTDQGMDRRLGPGSLLTTTDTLHPSTSPASPLPILQMGELSLPEEGEESLAIDNPELALALSAEEPVPALGEGPQEGLVPLSTAAQSSLSDMVSRSQGARQSWSSTVGKQPRSQGSDP